MSGIFVLEQRAKRPVYLFVKDINVLKAFIGTILGLIETNAQNYILCTKEDMTKFNTVAQLLIGHMNKYAYKVRKAVPEEIMKEAQNLFDWLVKLLKDASLEMPPPHYKCSEYGQVIKTLLGALDEYTTENKLKETS